MAACLSENTNFWYNYAGTVATERNAALEAIVRQRDAVRSILYDDVYRHAFEGGFVQMARISAELPDGQTFAVEVCMVCLIDETGRIKRLREYLDTAQLPAFPTAGGEA
jgi:ketosteroid isomerase-like protein